jgi:PIN domain
MAIYLDANILWSWRSFNEVDRLALSIVAHQTGQAVRLPEIAAREAEEHYRRSLLEAVERHESAAQDLATKFDQEIDVLLEPTPWVPDAVETWRQRLEQVAEVVPTDPADAVAALDREIVGRPPTKPRQKGKPGSGARDAAIWLTVLRDHRSRGEPSVFVTANKQDFATEGTWKADLATEVAELEHPLTLHLSLEALVETLGKPSAGPDPTLDELRRLVEPTLTTVFDDRQDLVSAYWGRLEPDWRYRSRVTAARPIAVRRTRRYERDADSVTLVDADWELDVTPCFQDIETDDPEQWSCLQGPVDVMGRIQAFVTERVGAAQPAQVIGATWSSPVSLYRQESGEILSLRRIPHEEAFGTPAIDAGNGDETGQ